MQLCLHSAHCIRSTIFFVVLAFLWNTGLVWPPKPLCFRSYRRLPCANRDALPVLYWVTFIIWCFLHPLQKAFLDLGMLTCCGVGFAAACVFFWIGRRRAAAAAATREGGGEGEGEGGGEG